MTTPPEGAQLSEDGHYWWDGGDWQLVDHAAIAEAAPAASAAPAAGVSSGSGSAAPAQPVEPPQVVLDGTAGFEPAFPAVGAPILYSWGEINRGGPITETYHAKVEFKNDDVPLDVQLVECTPLGTGEGANRSIQLSAPTSAGMGYTIELQVDVDHNTVFNEGNSAFHTFDVEAADS
jgi:hypothetical protein